MRQDAGCACMQLRLYVNRISDEIFLTFAKKDNTPHCIVHSLSNKQLAMQKMILCNILGVPLANSV